ncbi:uncharacterized protein LOC111384634 isoform X2 [Olea europaea var. sylvestris]|uniref:uncharacterized protein LOC111384634 isoform X2 n=1 Tax=Olea europaea var. sylvestris TaxID=158386 RepID=UPI000C1D75C9|nr:uncharacterized protein LOC111384634 isoform X2 [Olea europaea var. sylvestris]
MDFKGLAWADNVYEKFEAMCLEVEEVMRQDTVKYVENQVQKVGINVKKLYSEIMQDLLPLSGVDPVKVAAGDVSLSPCAHLDMNEKPKAMLENSDLKKESTEDKLNADEDVGKKLSLSGLGDKRGTSLLCNLRESCVPPSDQTNVMLSTDLVGSCNSVDAVITNDSIIKAPVAEDKFDVGVIHNDEVVEPRADILEQYDKSNLEESCVMVEGDMLRFFLQETAKQKSFKKKIREAFLSKLISRKPEYHKLFVQYGNRDGMEATEMVIPGSNKVSDNAKLQGLNFSDSDWELL